jgi:hypothetical protein
MANKFAESLKEIASRDLHKRYVFLCHSIDLQFLHLVELFCCFLNYFFVSNFLSLRSEFSLLVQYIFKMPKNF